LATLFLFVISWQGRKQEKYQNAIPDFSIVALSVAADKALESGFHRRLLFRQCRHQLLECLDKKHIETKQMQYFTQ